MTTLNHAHEVIEDAKRNGLDPVSALAEFYEDKDEPHCSARLHAQNVYAQYAKRGHRWDGPTEAAMSKL